MIEPFWEMTIDLQNQTDNGTHRAIWEALPAIEYLLRHLERLKESVPKKQTRIRECVMNSWSLLQNTTISLTKTTVSTLAQLF
jgi:hypothetical protein